MFTAAFGCAPPVGVNAGQGHNGTQTPPPPHSVQPLLVTQTKPEGQSLSEPQLWMLQKPPEQV
jgi:hypothetical protein